jgi:hypothetical protein
MRFFQLLRQLGSRFPVVLTLEVLVFQLQASLR